MTREQWEAIQEKDSRADGQFWYALKNGQTFCRPSCPTKSPQADRVQIFQSCQEARRAGYRPCRVCRPEETGWQSAGAMLAERARTYMREHLHEKFVLQDMANALQVDGSYLLRTFHRLTGMTLLGYHHWLRCQEAETLLHRRELSMAQIAGLTGFSSQAHFSRVFRQIEGVSPAQYRKQALQDGGDEIQEAADGTFDDSRTL